MEFFIFLIILFVLAEIFEEIAPDLPEVLFKSVIFIFKLPINILKVIISLFSIAFKNNKRYGYGNEQFTYRKSFKYEYATPHENEGNNPKTYIDEWGYKRFSDSGKSVSRWIAEKKLGRSLYPDEVVHHINGNKLDNSPTNLFVCSNQGEHERIHGENKRDAYRFRRYDIVYGENEF
jgi:hypothetical protein